jgi:precorrin-6B methylase 2
MMTHMRWLSRIKNSFVPRGRGPRRILSGAFAGVTLELDLHTQTKSWLGLYERELYGPLRRLAAGIGSAVDLGCAEGEFTAYFLIKTSAARVVAVDGNAEYLRALQRNLELNQQGNSGRLVVRHEYLHSLDLLVNEVEMPCLVKIDIDGGERDVLRLSPRFLALPDVRWVIEVHSPELERDCLHILQAAGYRAHIVKNAWWRVIIPDQRPIELNRWVVAESDRRQRDGK